MKEIQIGDVTITSIIERDGPWRTFEALFPNRDPVVGYRHLNEMEPFVFDQATKQLVITYQTFVIRTPRHRILVDTCIGENKGYPAPLDFSVQPWMDGFRALGLRTTDIDYVFCTHLHIDHCGWNTKLVDMKWVPSFPNAKYIFHRREYEFWEAETARNGEKMGARGQIWRMNCLPVVEAGQALLVNDDFALDDTIWLSPSPGHTPGHCCVNIQSRGVKAMVAGDIMHHAIQCREPDWSSIFCWDPAISAATRRRILSSVADTDTILMPVHFPGPTAGRVKSASSNFRFQFLSD